MSNDTLLYHYRGIRSRFLEADAHLNEVLSEAVKQDASDAVATRLDQARTLALAAYEDYSLIRKRLMASLLASSISVSR